jgi:hypothetical protein
VATNAVRARSPPPATSIEAPSGMPNDIAATPNAASITLHFMYMNFARPHKSLANPYPRTPAMVAGLADHIWTCEEIAALLD